jgi:hypothetical protein
MPLTYRIHDSRVVHEVIDGEVIMINLENGKYYTLNESGAVLWSLMQQGCDTEAMIALIAKYFSVPAALIERQGIPFFEQLLSEGLVSQENGPAMPGGILPEKAAAPYAPPELTVFSDMQDLLLLDPVHDTDEQGWPHMHVKGTA